MAVTIDVSYLSKLKTRATHGPSAATLITDAPRDNQGEGSAFSPTDLVATALATCALTTMAIAARRLGIELDGASAAIDKEMSGDVPRRIARLPLRLTLPPGVPEEHRQALEDVGRGCPVARSLSPEIAAEMQFLWG